MRLSTSWMHVASIYASWSAVMEKSAMPENVPLCLSRRAAATSTLWRRIVLPDAISLKTAASPHRRPDCTAIDALSTGGYVVSSILTAVFSYWLPTDAFTAKVVPSG